MRKPTSKTFPGWISTTTTPDKVEAQERRAEKLEIRVAELTRRLELANRDLIEARRSLESAGALRVLRALGLQARRLAQQLQRAYRGLRRS